MSKSIKSISSVEVSDSLWCTVRAPVHILSVFDSRLSADHPVSPDLQCDEHGSTIEEEEVSLPVSWIVMSFGINCSWHGPQGYFSHI